METVLKNQDLNHNRGFALYRKPGDEMKVLISGRVVACSGHSVPDADGFVFAPFLEQERFPKLFIYSEQKGLFSGNAANFLTPECIDPAWLYANLEPTSKDAYYASFARMRESMKRGVAEKVVLSKLVHYGQPLQQKWIHLFDHLSAHYPNAFVYAFASEASGLWIGATPEILLSRDGAMVRTVALAGTRSVSSAGSWRPKEFVEQQYVTRFIQQALLKCGVKIFDVKGPVTVKAGQVLHLQTSFVFDFDQISSGVWTLVDHLHPTPAVSGYPKKEAVDIILHEEQHEREYYSGYLGPVNATQLHLYVNIRCMKVTQSGAALFVGGGLTLASDAGEEWSETELKSQTLLSVLQNHEFQL